MERHYVGIDLHRRRSVIVRRDEHGVTRSTVRVDNSDSEAILAEVRRGRTRTRGRRRGDQRLVLARRPAPGERRERAPRAPPRQQLGPRTGEERRARRDRPRRPLPPRPPRRGLRRAARSCAAARARPVPPQARQLPHLRQRADPRSAREEGGGGADDATCSALPARSSSTHVELGARLLDPCRVAAGPPRVPRARDRDARPDDPRRAAPRSALRRTTAPAGHRAGHRGDLDRRDR